MAERVLKHIVRRCPLCRQEHEYLLVVRTEESPPLLFGGPEATGTAVSCPASGERFSISPRLEKGEKVTSVRSADGDEGDPGADDEDPEYADWVKTSRATAVDFGKTMLTTSAGAVAIYFAVLKYLGAEKVGHSVTGWISVIPPLLFLTSAAVFGWGLRPRLTAVSPAGFRSFRDNRLRHLDRMFTAGTGLFLLALAVAFGIFASVMP